MHLLSDKGFDHKLYHEPNLLCFKLKTLRLCTEYIDTTKAAASDICT